MGVDLAHQTQVALGAAVLGVALSLFFELTRVIGYFLRGALWQFVTDALRVLVCGIAVLLYFQRTADGQIRWYDLALLMLSGWLFHFCVGRFLVRPLCAFISLSAAFIKKVLMLLCYPLGLLCRLLGKITGYFTKITAAFLKKVFIFLKRYIIMIPYQLCLKRKKVKEAPRGRKTEEKEQGNTARFFH